jgi:hypothetical protein
MLYEMITSQIDESWVRPLQTILVDRDTISTILLHRTIFGITIVRPMGLLGQIQTSGLFAASYILWMLAEANFNSFIRSIGLLTGLLFLAATGTTQALLSFLVGAGVLLWFGTKRRHKVFIYALALTCVLGLVLILNSIGHLSTTREDSMLRLYNEGFEFLKSEKLPQCINTGCFWYINDTCDWFLPTFAEEILSGKFSSFLIDNGLINILFCLGAIFLLLSTILTLINWGCLIRYKRGGTLTNYAVTITAIYAAAYTSLLHVPVAISSVGISILIAFSIVTGINSKSSRPENFIKS